MKIDEKILVGARNAVETCLNVSNNDKVLIFTDKETKEIGLALRKAVFEVGAKSELLLLEEIGQRPLEQVPDSLWSYIADYKPTVSFFAAQNKKGEINFRIPLIETLRKDYRIRHGHMVGISTKLMKTGMQADYKEVDARTRAVFELVKNAREIVVKAPNGTDFLARFDPEKINWVVWGGLYHEPGLWGNLPEGEVFTSPINVNGVLKASVIGEYFSEKYGLLNPPINLMVQNGFLIESSHPNKKLKNEFLDYLSSVENGRRVGEFAIGTNEFLTELVGNLLQDEKFPGVHVAFGNPYNDYTGAVWTSSIHVDVVMEQVSIWVDQFQIMDNGKFVY